MQQRVRRSYFFGKSWLLTAIFAVTMSMHTIGNSACPCPEIVADRPLVVCDLLSHTVDTDQLRAQEACFQGPIQLCSGASGLPNSVLEGLWAIALQGQPVGPGESALQMIGRTRAVTCSGTIVTIDFNQQTADPADAFTLLKTIQAGDTLQFTRINPINCEAEQAVSACAAGSVTGCGPVLTVPVYDASGLSGLYGAVGQYVSLLNFGPKPSTSTQLGQLQDCTDCSPPTCPDLPCWLAQICTGLMTGFIPPECTSVIGANEHILINADHLGAVTAVAVPKTTLGGCSAVDIFCATRVGDRLRICAPGITNQTPLNAPPGQLGWSTSPVEPFGPVGFEGDQANAIAIDFDGNTILAGFHNLPNSVGQFAALQLVPNGTAVQLGWATALSGPFGPSMADRARGVAIDSSGSVILAGFHNDNRIDFSALQLIPNLTSVQLGWATAISEPFGSGASDDDGDEANAVVIDSNGTIILAGKHRTLSGINQFAALQLIPNGTASVQLGWTLALSAPFGPVAASLLAASGDIANAVALDNNGNIILAGSHNPADLGVPNQFAALQLIPVGTSVQLGWATALFAPFGSSVGGAGDQALGVTIDCNNNVILAGFHQLPDGTEQVAALQLIPDATSVGLGWSTALSAPFGPADLFGDVARGIAIDGNNAIILGGFHSPSPGSPRFATLQLIPSAVDVDLGWLTAVLPSNFVPSSNSRAHAVAIDQNNNVVLGGFNNPAGLPREQFAAVQLRQPFVPAYGDYEITSINEVGDFIIFGLTLIDTESSTVCPGQELCIKDFGFCCA